MEILNAARHTLSGVTTMMNKEGDEFLVLVIKATYRIPENGKIPRPLIPAQPILDSDLFYGDPGISAPRYEADYLLHKPMCDVLFSAQAHAPGNQPVTQLVVTAEVGNMSKSINVNGERIWEKTGSGFIPGKSKYFVSVPLHYGYAAGGIYSWENHGQEHTETHSVNPVGTGFARTKIQSEKVQILPALEAVETPINSPDHQYLPQALSVLPRNSSLRICYAGTYDDEWRRNTSPFLPTDFDERYCQSAPADQQIPFPVGHEPVRLLNMMQSRTEVRFKLPRLDNLPVRVLKKNYTVLEIKPVVDTLFFEPDEQRFSVVWRCNIPLERSIQEIQTVAIGPVCKNWWSTKVSGGDICSGCTDGDDLAEHNMGEEA